MPCRRPHSKSRRGCVLCKARRLKCDEVRPSCGRCTIRGDNCHFVNNSPEKHLTPPSHTTSPPSYGMPEGTLPRLHFTSSPRLQVPSPPASISTLPATSPYPSFGQCSLLDLELIHLYSTSTSLSFTSQPERQRVWQHAVPQLAFSHSFLLDGLLAISALHLSNLSPTRREMLRAYATQRQDTALSLFRVALAQMDSENCHACLAFSGLLGVLRWASSDGSIRLFFADPEQDAQNDAVNWVQLLCGAGEVIKQYYHELLQGPMAPILPWDNEAEKSAELNPAESVKFGLLEQLFYNSEAPFSDTELNALKGTLHTLQVTYTMMCNTRSNVVDNNSLGLSWVVRIPELYLQIVSRRDPVALVVLAHFCLLLNRMENTWLISGLSRRLLQDIHQMLGKEWESQISWPLQDLVLHEFQNNTPGTASGRSV
ncbi:hypothetical protein BKA65DRAFT_111095 [Rhexocercosporidium sp. MPI-PUGE-AT-0058]|nr:hypothetical protein BKA65DRAFT_111095 [Rhexocercosporidium sp. MPI-PUGE-AT-0058]